MAAKWALLSVEMTAAQKAAVTAYWMAVESDWMLAVMKVDL